LVANPVTPPSSSRHPVSCIARAGPAGCAVAISLCRAGKTVDLVSPTRRVDIGPRNLQTFGRNAVALLEQCSVSRRDLASVASPVEVFNTRWNTRGEHYEMSGLSCASSIVIDRRSLDPLLEQAARNHGANLISDRALSIYRTKAGRRWSVTCEQKLLVETTIVVDASGRSARFARRAGCRLKVFDSLIAWTVEGYKLPSSTKAAVEIEACDEGWIYRASDGVGPFVSTFFGSKARRSPGFSGFDRAKSGENPSSGVRIESAAVTYLDTAVTPGLVAVGDASHTTDPLSGQGVAMALEEGLLLGTALANALEGDNKGVFRFEALRRQKIETHIKERRSHYLAAGRFENSFWAERCRTD